MNEELHLNAEGEALIKSFESLQLTAYDDGGMYAIGWGHRSPDIKEGDTVTPERAQELFEKDVAERERKVRRYVSVQLNERQFSALCSFAFNVSTAHFIEMLDASRLNEGNYSGVPKALMRFDMSQGKRLAGLTIRRLREGQLFTES